MCMGCWDEEGRPTIDNMQVRHAASLIPLVYEHNCVGGHLHVLLDDWNTEDCFIDSCRQYIEENVNDASNDQRDAERLCLDAFQPLSEKERISALALDRGFWSVLQ